MTLKEKLKVMETEYACILRNDGGNCSRECKNCDLALPIEDIKYTYEDIIASLKYLIEREEKRIKKGLE